MIETKSPEAGAMRGDWWSTFFGAGFPDDSDPAAAAAEAAGVVHLLGLVAGDRVLDAPCGHGRLAGPLAAAGMLVTGVDLSIAALERARRGSIAAPYAIRFVRQDIRNLRLQRRFDAALCTFGSFGYFSDYGNQRFLASITRNLRPGGRFLLDTPTVEVLLPRLGGRVYRVPGGSLTEECRFHTATRRVESLWRLRTSNGYREERTSIRLYSTEELFAMLSRSGMRVVRHCGSLIGEPFGPWSERLVLVATVLDGLDAHSAPK